MTTQQLRKLLRERHAPKNRTLPAWAYLEEVRNQASYDGDRTIDALALTLWKSRGYELHGYEIKSSRSDLLKEIRTPEKAEPFFRYCDRFWLVCPTGLCKDDELPLSWGLLVPSANGESLRVAKRAPLNDQAQRTIDRSFLVCLLRSAGAALKYTPDELAIKSAREQSWNQGYEAGLARSGQYKSLYEQAEAEMSEFRAWTTEFQRVFGVTLAAYNKSNTERRQEIMDALRAVLGESEAVHRSRLSIRRAAMDLRRASKLLLDQADQLCGDEAR